MFRHLAFVVSLALGGLAGAAHAEGVALTFDDAPAFALTEDVGYAAVTTDRLVADLRRRHVPATAFVIGRELDGADGPARRSMARRWRAAGMVLGSHSYDHESLNKVGPQAYVADLARADARLRALLSPWGERPRWFRHPYLETGATPAVRQAVDGWLFAHGYRVAPVTLENADWMFALPYDDAVLRGDAAAAARIREAYLAYTARATQWYRGAAFVLFGRRPDLVLLLHASRLNADVLGDLLGVLRAQDLRPVPLAVAMRDPAYRTPDGIDADGDEWLSRWSQVLGRELPWDDFPEPPADIAALNDRLDTAP